VDLIDRVAETLARYPHVPFRREGARIEVAAAGPEGFEVSIAALGDGQIVHYGRWHERFTDPEQATGCFMLGLTPGARLQVTRRGGLAHAWTVEVRGRAGWNRVGTVGLLLFPFWKRKEVVTLQNRWIEGPPPGVTGS
jgi:hypothetical protein